ncbi:glutathione-dependent formaldehyde-activating protein [Enterobacter asburiae]|uniref:Glutathione-dependent formaldehyde-activating protein n=1 Tax=Enterobacter asburiae TaxID=61645 RepID=A0A376FDB7_ENTAS|nr:glutathione-dependent formaldehyde-activating protein [Enterobacter asburiae]
MSDAGWCSLRKSTPKPNPRFFGLTGQYARYSGSEIEALDKHCLLTP